MIRLICPKCRTTYVFTHDAAGRIRRCDKCGLVLSDGSSRHLEQTLLNDRERVWSDKLLLSVFPEGVTL